MTNIHEKQQSRLKNRDLFAPRRHSSLHVLELPQFDKKTFLMLEHKTYKNRITGNGKRKEFWKEILLLPEI
jgi:hypothetical protein